MQTTKYETRQDWLAGRLGKITGSRLKDVIIKRGTTKKLAFWELVAERLATRPDVDDTESPIDRGTRLEPEAIARFSKETGKKVDTSLVIWNRDDNESIAISPDGSIGKTEAIETKCLSSALHIKAFITQEIPTEYDEQKLQYFIVNEKLKTLYFVFYDPRIPVKDYFVIPVKRKDIEQELELALAWQRDTLNEVEEIVNKLTF
jgi:predicted phage-related endonuclease